MTTKQIMMIMAGITIASLAIAGTFVPEARAYNAEIIKMLLGMLPSLAQ